MVSGTVDDRPRAEVPSAPAAGHFASGRFRARGQEDHTLKEVILTPEGYKKLQAEIEYLSTDRRREIAERIRDAREFGDIAENAEYDSAKNEQAHLEARIAMLEERLDERARRHEEGDHSPARSRSGRRSSSGLRPNKIVRVPHRRLGRGEPGGEQALERVAGRQGDHGPQEGRVVEAPRRRARKKFKIMDIKAA